MEPEERTPQAAASDDGASADAPPRVGRSRGRRAQRRRQRGPQPARPGGEPEAKTPPGGPAPPETGPEASTAAPAGKEPAPAADREPPEGGEPAPAGGRGRQARRGRRSRASKPPAEAAGGAAPGGEPPSGVERHNVPAEVLEAAAEKPADDWVAEQESPPPPDREPEREPRVAAASGEAPTPAASAAAPSRGRRRRGRGRGRDKAPEPEAQAPEAKAAEPAPEPKEAKEEKPEKKPRQPRRARGARETKAAKEAREAKGPKEAEQAEEAPAPRATRAARAPERIQKEIVINVDDRETRIAIVEDGRLMELHVERDEQVVGGIYKARVANVLPGMDAAFVDIDLERNAFLYVGDILYDTSDAEESAPRNRKPRRDVHIKDVARPGQELLVQVVKGPRGTKGARVSTRISLPGRYLVLMPEADQLGVSRKVEDPRERDRLRKIGEQLRPDGFGLIIRTEAEEHTEEELTQDLNLLVKLWKEIEAKAGKVRAPALIHRDLSLIMKTIRDLFGADVDRLSIDSEVYHGQAVEMLELLQPELVPRIHCYSDPTPIFARYNVEEEVERLLRRKVWLKSGGYLTIDSTEALTTLDVNTGKFVGTTSLQDTILKTNLEAVSEVARQLRLRDIGGMIVIDFIDMASARDRQQVMRALEQVLRKDRTRTKIAHISPLGLVEMTRKRTAETVIDIMTETCPYCQGRGRIWSPETMSIHIEREIKRRVAEQSWDAVLVHVSPEVAAWMIGPEGEHVEKLEREIRRPVYVRARHDFHVEKFELLPGDMMEMEEGMLPFRGGQVVEADVTKIDLITPPRSAAWVNGFFVDLANGARFQGQSTRVRLTDVRRSYALGEPVPPSTAIDKTEPI